MISAICSAYSGVVLEVGSGGAEDESLIPSSIKLMLAQEQVGNTWWYQTFRLPEGYGRGIENTLYPPLSGFQLLLNIASEAQLEAELNYVIEQYVFDVGWEPLTKGNFRGVHTDGERVWMDVIFDKPLAIDAEMVPNAVSSAPPFEFRIGFQAQRGINEAWYITPNPYAYGRALEADGTKLSYSFAFRVLGLIADSGFDFLGNPYRSAIATLDAHAPAENSGYWLSAPQPSKFAVVSHYSDIRP